MAEVIGLASAVAGVLTLIGQATKLSYVFLSDIRGASKSQKLYLQEISALTEVLLRIEQALEVQELWSARPSILTGALQDCQEFLRSLKTSLDKAIESSSRIDKLKSSLKWPFDEKEVKRLVEMLHRYRDIFVTALSSDTFAISVATYRRVDDLGREHNYQRILEWLGNPGPQRSPSALFDSACPGTGQWLLVHEEYLEWRDGRVSFLWCHGKPGVGKTVITSIVLNNLYEVWKSPTASIAYHFCDFTERKVEKTIVILQHFLQQIVHEANPIQLSMLEQSREKFKNPSLKELSRTLSDVALVKSNACVIVDALDEFGDRKALIPILRELAKAGIKVFVTSRDIPDIRDAFGTERNLEIEASRADLGKFVEHRFQESDYYDSLSPGAAIVSAIVDQAGGMFLLARLLMKHLLGLTTIKQMRQALKSMPSNLVEAYESSLRRILEQPPSRADLAMRVIGWVTHAERRLKVEELRHALAVEEGTSKIDEENLTLVKVILQVCIGLASVDPADGTIGMIHVTAYDYFRHVNEQFSDIQLDMAKTSMLYLGFHPLGDGPCSSVEPLRNRFRDMPFLGYAVGHWGDHARQVEREMSRQILQFLNESGARASSFQALQYHELRDPKLAVAVFESLPTGQQPLHVAAYWNLTLTAESFLKDGTNPTMPDAQGWTPLHWASSQGCDEMVELLLEYQAHIDACDHSGWTPLFWATIKSHKQIVSRLLQANANHLLADSKNWTVLHWAAAKGNTAITQILLDHHSKFKARQMPVKIWIKDITVEQAKQLCKSPAHVSKAPLEIAADRQDIHTFNTILNDLAVEGSTRRFNELWAQRGFDEPSVSVPWRILTKADRFDRKGLGRWDINDKRESSAAWKSKLLHGAIRDGKTLVVQLLIELGADLRSTDYGRTPLQQAAFLKDPEIAEILLAHGADTSGNTRGGETPLHFAVACGFERTAGVLLRGGVDINSKNHHGKTPLMLACENRPKDDPTLECVPSIMVKMLIDHGADIHAIDRWGCNALHLAVQSQPPDPRITKLLLQGGIDANVPDTQGYTPLHYFSKGSLWPTMQVDPRMEETFDILLAHSSPGAPNLEHRRKNSRGLDHVDTPLSFAIESGNWQVFHLLLAKGAVLQTTRSLNDLLWKASKPKAVETLLAQGASATIKPYGTPIGHRALEGLLHEGASTVSPFEDFKSILKMYIDAGLDINTTNEKSESLLHVAVVRAKEPHESALAQYLIEVGADVYQPVCGAWDAFLLAAVHGRLSALRVLVARAAKALKSQHWMHLERLDPSDGGDDIEVVCASLARSNLIDSKDLEGLTPLQKAVKLGNTSTASRLLSHGADLHIRDEFGWTVLHTATYERDEAMVRLLLQAGSDVGATSKQWAYSTIRPSLLYQGDVWKGTSLHLAAMFGQPAVAQLLIQHGADVHADTGLEGCRPGHGPTALHIALDTGIFYTSHLRVNLGPEMLRVAEILVENGAEVEGAANHIDLNDVPKFEEFDGLWEKLRRGITGSNRITCTPVD